MIKPIIQIKIQDENSSPRMHLNYTNFEKFQNNERILISMSYDDIKSNYVKLGLILKRNALT